MPKVSKLKIVEISLLPLVSVLAVKLVTIFFLSVIFNIPWGFIGQGSFNYYFLSFSAKNDLVFLSTWSDFFTILFLAVWFSWIVFRANHLSEDNIHPSLAAKLLQLGREFLIGKSLDVYHELVAWLLLLWVFFLSILLNFLVGATSSFVLGVSLAVVAILLAELLSFNKKFRN